MSVRRILGLILIVGGLAMVLISNYIKGQVEGGKQQISSAQKKVNQADGLFSMSPATKQIGKGMTEGAQKKIDAGKEQVAYYAQLASQLQTGGWIALALGAILVIIPQKKQSRR